MCYTSQQQGVEFAGFQVGVHWRAVALVRPPTRAQLLLASRKNELDDDADFEVAATSQRGVIIVAAATDPESCRFA